MGVSQTYAGFSGGPFQTSSRFVTLDKVNYAKMDKFMTEHEKLATGETVMASYTYLYKPLTWDGTRTAVMLLNSENVSHDLTLNLADVPGLKGPCNVRDIWAKSDLGKHDESITVSVESHDGAFLVLSDCTSAPLPPPPAGSKIVNPKSGKCLDIKDNYDDKAQVQIYTCTGEENQEWQVQDNTIVNPHSGKCLDIEDNGHLPPDQYKDETKVELYTCNGNPNQQWKFQDGQLVNPPSGKCLDIYSPHGALDDETPVQLFTCRAAKGNQAWELQDEILVV